MSRKRHRPEEIVAKLRQVEVLTAQGRTVAEAIRSIGVTEVSSGTGCSTVRSSPRSRGEDRDRGLASARQHDQPALVPWLRPARPGGRAVAGCASPTSSAGHPGRGAPACHALTCDPDHFMGPAS
jgi:putative transposase